MSRKNESDPAGASHAAELPRLNRVRGQLEGVARMIEDRRYCPDILVQLAAARAAIRAVEMGVLTRHMQECVRHAIRTPERAEKMIGELVRLLRKA